MNKNNYECKRCSYQCYQLNDMKRHFNKKKLCIRNIESYSYNDDDLLRLSLVRNNIINENIIFNCTCGKIFHNKSNLNRHKKSCKNINNTDNINKTDNNNVNNADNIDKNNIDKLYINNIITTNNTNNRNHITNNINLNINLINSFDKNWTTNHIDNKTKFALLLNNSKFTKTLENILENEVNLNVLIDNTSDNGIVYNNDKLISMNIKDIVKRTMDKLYNQLCDFKNDILEPNNMDIDKKILDEQINIVQNKYDNYKEDENLENTVNVMIKDIYNKKKEDTLINYNLIKTNILQEGY